MEFRKVLALRGPNIWARFPVLEAWVDLGTLPAPSSSDHVDFYNRLKSWLPSLPERPGSLGLAHVLENVVLELQIQTGAAVDFSRTAETAEPQVFRVAVQYEVEAHGRDCLSLAHQLCLAALHNSPCDPAKEIERLKFLYNETRFGPSTLAIVRAARDRGIPVHRLSVESLTQLGDGVRQRRFRTAVTDQTGAAAHEIAQDKELTKALLRQVGVPVPEGRPVTSPEDAWEAACEVGLPVVVKPRDGNHGRGVTLNLKCREHVMDAYRFALGAYRFGLAESEHAVLLERFAPGTEHRLLVVGGRMVAALRGEPDQVFGDGVHTVRELVEELNRDPRRGVFYRCLWLPVLLDEIALVTLEQQGLQFESIPEAGRKVIIHQNGEYTIDCTDEVHPEVAARAVLAAQTVGLDVAGMDIIATDISRPLEEQGGVIVEVNAGPAINMHLVPLVGKPRAVGAAILETMFAPGESGRIPLISVAGTEGRNVTTKLVAHVLRETGRQVGMTSAEGTFLNSRRLSRLDGTSAKSTRNILINPWVEAGVFETSAEGILHEGLGFDFCDVAVVTHLGENEDRDGEISSSEQAILQHTDSAYRTLMDSVASTGWAVLKADDPATAALAEHCRGGVVYFAQDEHHPLLSQHREQGGRVVFVRQQTVMLAEGSEERALISADQIPAAQAEHVLAAIGAVWALQISLETICEGLVSYLADAGSVKVCASACNGSGASHSSSSNGHSTHAGRNGSRNGKASHIAPSAMPASAGQPTAEEASLPASGSSEVTS
jgi:cyanophycin synthetase